MTLLKPSPRLTISDFVDGCTAYAILICDLARGERANFQKCADGVDILSSEGAGRVRFRAHCRGYMLRMSHILQILKAVVCTQTIAMMYVYVLRRLPQKGQRNQPMNMSYLPLSVFAQLYLGIPQGVDPSLQNTTRPLCAACVNAPKRFYSAKIRNFVEAFVSGDWLPDFVRGRIGAHGECPFAVSIPRPFQRRWGNFVAALQYITNEAEGQASCL